MLFYQTDNLYDSFYALLYRVYKSIFPTKIIEQGTTAEDLLLKLSENIKNAINSIIDIDDREKNLLKILIFETEIRKLKSKYKN